MSTNSTPYFVPTEPGRWRAITLAALVHAALLAFLWVGIRWQNQTPIAVEAEIWNPVTEQAAPLPVEKTAAEPEIRSEPAPVAKPLPKPDLAPLPIAKPDIALAQEKKRKALKEQQERLEEERRQAKLLKQKDDQERLKKQKIADQKLAEKEKADALAQKKREAEDAKKAAADKKRKQDAAEDAKLAKMREENMRQLTGSGANGNAGSAAKSQGSSRDTAYEQKIAAKIKSNTIFNVPDDLAGNPGVVYEIRLYPDGSTGEIQLKKPSGVPGFDEAVKRAIKKSEPFPADKSGKFPPSITLSHKPKDQ